MSLRLKVDITACIFDFKNIELCNQGHYYAEIQFFVQTENAKYPVTPDEYEKIKWKDSQIILPSKNCQRQNIDKSSRNGIKRQKVVYKTQGWNIRFTEEECILNEVAYFTSLIDLPQLDCEDDVSDLRIPLMMEVSLFFHE
jgi:hypothetical protein